MPCTAELGQYSCHGCTPRSAAEGGSTGGSHSLCGTQPPQVQENLAAGARLKAAKAQRSASLAAERQRELAANQARAVQVQEERAQTAAALERLAQERKLAAEELRRQKAEDARSAVERQVRGGSGCWAAQVAGQQACRYTGWWCNTCCGAAKYWDRAAMSSMHAGPVAPQLLLSAQQ